MIVIFTSSFVRLLAGGQRTYFQVIPFYLNDLNPNPAAKAWTNGVNSVSLRFAVLCMPYFCSVKKSCVPLNGGHSSIKIQPDFRLLGFFAIPRSLVTHQKTHPAKAWKAGLNSVSLRFALLAAALWKTSAANNNSFMGGVCRRRAFKVSILPPTWDKLVNPGVCMPFLSPLILIFWFDSAFGEKVSQKTFSFFASHVLTIPWAWGVSVTITGIRLLPAPVVFFMFRRLRSYRYSFKSTGSCASVISSGEESNRATCSRAFEVFFIAFLYFSLLTPWAQPGTNAYVNPGAPMGAFKRD